MEREFLVCAPRSCTGGINVAVKQFKENVSLSLIKQEASILAKMDHPGNHQAPLFRRLDNAIHQINHYPVDKC